jgi:2,3-bisphosphoglycerate-independent phosphoglycerate mutase
MSSAQRPLVLAILDGWGIAAPGPGNAITNAQTPHWNRITDAASITELAASGEPVGLPKGVMGNSEVGHINIGSGRCVPQGVVVINESIADGTFATNDSLAKAVAHVKSSGGRIHLLGLLSDGSVHSSIVHLEALVEALNETATPFVIHAIGDGRDVPPSSMQQYLTRIEGFCSALGHDDAIASICGRFYAMDRDSRWERTQAAYNMLAGVTTSFDGVVPTQTSANATEALKAAYGRGETDEFVPPTLIGQARTVANGDVVIFFNFRPDRARQMTMAFTDAKFAHFTVQHFENFQFVTMTRYDEQLKNPILFGPRPQADTFGEIIAQAGLSQLRLAETEKYAHVTYFFNGGREDVFPGEDRELIPSDRSVSTYDLAPAMQAEKITDVVVADLAAHKHDVIVLNYANADMVGHTGKMAATVSSIQTLDGQLGRLYDAVMSANGILAITADHGNAEEKLDAKGNPLTAHTTNPVPFLLLARESLGKLESGGALGDIAPTLLPLLGLAVPQAMTGRPLLSPAVQPTSA